MKKQTKILLLLGLLVTARQASAQPHCAIVEMGADIAVTIRGIGLAENAGPRPIRVQATSQNGGDREDMVLVADKADPNTGKASLPTREREAVPNNGVLEVTMGDLITCSIDNTGLQPDHIGVFPALSYLVVPPEKALAMRLGTSEKDRKRASDSAVTALAFSPDETTLAVANKVGEIAVWSLATEKPSWRSKTHTKRIVAMRYRSDGQALLTASEDGRVLLFDAASGNVSNTVFTTSQGWDKSPEPIRDFDFLSTDASRIAIASYRNVMILESQTCRVFRPANFVEPAYSVDCNPDGTLLLATKHRMAQVWDIKEGQLLFQNGDWATETAIDAPFISGGVFSPDGKAIALSRDNGWGGGQIELYDWATREKVRDISVSAGHIKFAFSPDGRLIASAGANPVVEIFDAQTGALLRQYRGHDQRVECITFSPGGTKVATGSWDQTAIVWDMKPLLQDLEKTRGRQQTGARNGVPAAHDP